MYCRTLGGWYTSTTQAVPLWATGSTNLWLSQLREEAQPQQHLLSGVPLLASCMVKTLANPKCPHLSPWLTVPPTEGPQASLSSKTFSPSCPHSGISLCPCRAAPPYSPETFPSSMVSAPQLSTTRDV